MKKILYIQFTDPGGYPPLIHSANILASNGWKVLILGIYPFGGKAFRVSDSQNIQVLRLKYTSSIIFKKAQYVLYFFWSVYWVAKFKPSWIYASDHFSTPIAWVLKKIFDLKCVYHEHDSILSAENCTNWIKLCLYSRNRLAQRSEVIVLPNESRIEAFKCAVKNVDPICVFNCAGINEVSEKRIRLNAELNLVYCGSINESRLRTEILEAMSICGQAVKLTIIGYETVGSIGYLKKYQDHASRLGLSKELQYLGPLEDRAMVLEVVRRCDLGLSFMPNNSDDINVQYMAGASNKPFDYLSQGVAVLVSDHLEWQKLYVETGYGFACNPESVQDMKKIFNYCSKNLSSLMEMGEKGRKKIIKDWNYEKQFKPVLEKINFKVK